jgi:hypothetical protein
MVSIKLLNQEVKAVSDLLLFKYIVIDESNAVIDVLKRFEIYPEHRITGLCEPMSYISQNFIELTQYKSIGSKNNIGRLSAITVLEEQIIKEFCLKGIHALDLAIKLDALAVFHALLDYGHKDVKSQAVHLAVKYIRVDMLNRLAEEGYDLWFVHPDWESRPIDTLFTMLSFQEELPFIKGMNVNEELAECLDIIIKNSEIYRFISTTGDDYRIYNGNPIIRKRKGLAPEIEEIFFKVIHGLL